MLQRRVAPYLIARGLLDPATVVDGDLEVVPLTRRHSGLQVRFRADGESENGSAGYFVKQATVADREAALAHEAAVYESLQRVSAPNLAPYLPRFVLYDHDSKLLVLELVAGARTLREYHASSGRFPTTPASQLGQALGALHATRAPDAVVAPAERPWVLRAHQPSFGFFCDLSGASVELLGVLQRSDDLCSLLEELGDDWRRDSVVHNDARWDNCIVFPRGATRRTTGFKLIDWELAGYGDALWDAGSALSQYLAFWLLSIPAATDVTLRELPDLARHPIDRMQPAIRTFWHSYVTARDLDHLQTEEAVIRATRYAAAQLVQAAIENTQSAPRLTAFAVLCLQLALNVGTEPERAAVQLLGLDVRAPARS